MVVSRLPNRVNDLKTVGERLNHARRLRNMTQGHLAEKSRVSQTLISNLERGDQSSSKFLVDLANALSVSVNWLSSGKGNPDSVDVIPDAIDYAQESSSSIAQGDMLRLQRVVIDLVNQNRDILKQNSELILAQAALHDRLLAVETYGHFQLGVVAEINPEVAKHLQQRLKAALHRDDLPLPLRSLLENQLQLLNSDDPRGEFQPSFSRQSVR